MSYWLYISLSVFLYIAGHGNYTQVKHMPDKNKTTHSSIETPPMLH